MAIIYLHGFASSGQSAKVDALREAMQGVADVYGPDLPVDPSEAAKAIGDLIATLTDKGDDKILLVGTSLGGFYAWALGRYFSVPAVLINPAMNPQRDTLRYLGRQTNHQTGRQFEWTLNHVDKLAALRDVALDTEVDEPVDVFVALDDDVIDASDTIRELDGKATINVLASGGHRFTRFDETFPTIRERYQQIRPQPEPFLL